MEFGSTKIGIHASKAKTLPVRMTACSRIEAETSAALFAPINCRGDPIEIRGGTSSPMMRCLARKPSQHARNEVAMATKQHDRIVETPTEARQAEPGPSVFALLTVSTGLAILFLGIVWFVFFRT
jgi:hypothetical protein